MSLIDAKNIIKQLANLGFPLKMLSLFWLGEPLINPQIIDIISFIKETAENTPFFQECELHTNALLFTPDLQKRLLDHIPEGFRILFSIDAYNKNTYKKIKHGNFEEVINNIKYFIKNSSKYNIQAIFQFIVTKDNFEEYKSFYKLFSRLFKENDLDYQVTAWHDWTKNNVIYYKYCDPLTDCENNNQKYFDSVCEWVKTLPEHKVFYVPEFEQPESIYPCPDFIYPCASCFENPTIRWDGEMTTCCHDTAMGNSLGNIIEHGFERLWFGEKINLLREQMLCGKPIFSETCKNCSFRYSNNTHHLNEYYLFRLLKRLDLSHLISKYIEYKAGKK